MLLDWIKRIWSFINGLSSTAKSIIICTLIVMCAVHYINQQGNQIISKYSSYIEQKNDASENYTIKMAPVINQCVKNIALQDTSVTDILILTTHNTKKSLQGFSYIYLDALTEYINDYRFKPLRNRFRELEYINYEDELSVIFNKRFVRVDDMATMQRDFPKLFDNIADLDIQACAFYSLYGTERQLGLICIFYKNKPKYIRDYYNVVVAPSAQRLSAILDYNNIRDEIKE